MDALAQDIRALAVDSLAARIQALPSELRDMIRGFVFIASSATRHINADWKPPSSLHVSFDTHHTFLRSYYRKGMIFLIDRDVVAKWLDSLCETTRIKMMMCTFRMNVPSIEIGDMSLTKLSNLIRDDYLQAADVALRAWNSPFDPSWLYSKLHFHVTYGTRRETAWIVQRDTRGVMDRNVPWLHDARWSALAWLRAGQNQDRLPAVYQELVGSGV